jgi:ribosomal protein L7Ae-like RNA K-turn-binding protein
VLVRLIVNPNGEVAVDARGGGFGRGAHVHPRPECLVRAVQRGLSRSAKTRVHTIQPEPVVSGKSSSSECEPLHVESLARAIEYAMHRRIEGLLVAAVRSKHIAIGAAATSGALERGEAELVVVASDAAAAADLTHVRRAIVEGRAVAWGTKDRLGAFGGRQVRSDGLAVLAITSRQIGEALQEAVHVADACAAIAAGKPKMQTPTKPAGDHASEQAVQRRNSAAERGNSREASARVPPSKAREHGLPHGEPGSRNGQTRRDRGRGAPINVKADCGGGGQPREARRRGWNSERVSQGAREAKRLARGRRSGG